jgi:hypothetical protein
LLGSVSGRNSDYANSPWIRPNLCAQLCLLVVLAQAGRCESTESGAEAPEKITRLAPSAFAQLAIAARTELEIRHCRIPQSQFETKQPNNVIHGTFRKAGQTDWGVLCSEGRSSRIFVFWNGEGKPVQVGQESPDSLYLQNDEHSIPRYSHLIIPVSPHEVVAYPFNEDLGPFDHDGIYDAFSGKASTIYYFRKGKWVVLNGFD